MFLDYSVGAAHFVSVIVAVEDFTDYASSGVEGFVVVFVVLFECMGYSVNFYHCSSLLHLLYFCKLGSQVPIHTSVPYGL